MSTWSPEEEQKLLRMWLLEDKTQREIARHLEKSTSAVSRRVGKLNLRGESGNVGLYEHLTGQDVEAVLEPVRYNIEPRKAPVRDSIDYVTLLWGDCHFPFQDQRAIDVVQEVAHKVQPDQLVCLGDVYDYWQISNHRPPSETQLEAWQADLQETIEMGSEHLAIMAEESGAREKTFLGGNHEDRHDRLLLDVQSNHKMRYLLRLPKVSEAMKLEYLLGLEDMDYDYIPYDGSNRIIMKDRLVAIHGNKTNKWVTRSLLTDYGKSVIFGHTHRIQNWTQRTLKGQEAAWSVGCLCELEVHYQQMTDWHQGFALVSWKETSDGWLYDVDQIRIHDGRAVWRDHYFEA